MKNTAALVLLLAASSCDPSSRALSGSDCKPRKLTTMDSCSGKDMSFQECRFYFRAGGTPERSWCESMPKAGAPNTSKLSACDFSSPASWAKVACSPYGIAGAATCYACSSDEHEARKTYVYAYSPDCARGIEQVTCNFDPLEAGEKLGRVTL